MATMTDTLEFEQHRLQVRPQPLRLRSGNKRHGIIFASPPSPEPSTQSSDLCSEKAELELRPVDRGLGAWKFLFAAFMIEGFMFGENEQGSDALFKLIMKVFRSITACSKITTPPMPPWPVTTTYPPSAPLAPASTSSELQSQLTLFENTAAGIGKLSGQAFSSRLSVLVQLDGRKILYRSLQPRASPSALGS